ncbi:hypothetical protein OS493_013288 [Desmophyllum pertusum]|uniref:SAC3/GANP/THP3 conserved domain-containing protein n=1 Tax=Desmophyllum pertusum TaxID=174260 RepID=A0A9W9YQE8_9CNID|nr:hypothetical protein OS493_013288 [Desmophyllum pertusum]
MLSQIRQKKKKEAVRRLSQGSGATGHPRDHGTALSSQVPWQGPQRRKFSDQQRIWRQQPGATGQRPAKRSYASTLDQDPTATGDMEPKPVNPVGTAAFGFGTTQSSLSSQASQFTHTATTDATSTFSTVSGFGSGFPPSSLQHSTGEASATIISSASGVFGSGFGKTETKTDVTVSSASQSSNAPVNIFATGPHTSSSLLAPPSQGSNPVFGSGFNNSVASTSLASSSSSILFKLAAAVKQPPSNSLTFGGFSNVGPSPSTEVSSSNTFVLQQQQEAIRQKKNKEKVAEEKIRGLGTSTLTALVIKDIPDAYNKNAWLKRFYSRFGEVIKVLCSVARKSATVTFKTHEAAELAKKKGKILRPGLPPVVIFWKQQGSRRSTTSESDQPTQLSPDVDKSIDKRHLSPGKTRKVFKQIQSTEEQSAHRIKCPEVLKDIQEYLQSVQPSENAGEKLQLLEGIDKKLRQAFKRSLDITSAKAVIGTCKDMCPEKERYMREYQRRLSVFEAVPGTGSIDENPQVDHTRAVKEYDRSAADKEDPLREEKGNGLIFVWNRTRGIRKDITQQHLCDPDCVDLVEKTARFHIICAHFLCEADMNSFDAKINTENLTKCLQTLKQFYGDLYKDEGITCPQEAEFRAYDILLNLNEGDILREVMTFRDEVQKSAEVKFAMAVFHAVNKQ